MEYKQGANRERVPTSEKLLVSEDEAAQLLSVSKPTFRRIVADGHVRPVELPGSIRRNLYRRADLDAFTQSLEHTAP